MQKASVKRHDAEVHSTDYFRGYVPPEEAHPSTTRPVIESKDKRYFVDSGASTCDEFFFSDADREAYTKKNKQSPGENDIQQRGGVEHKSERQYSRTGRISLL